ncbi:unnamed protein product [Rotaria socialis]|uniref:Uncharacterized protein n=3 Tax=Rotaria socialis TaxID=392032 RepID=A0A817QYW4_9BILA|nr:unnamed protein product [Rotaria socialis]CAF3370718.1 unnamed protein product [Rotaria socialis]CAF4510884.1 unnamed protein product [Rotaria socialis]CAF4535470.1 unnamed protein product [Rotaria socialis]
MMNVSTILDDSMNTYFQCKNGQNVLWTSVCDGRNQCTDGSDEHNCYCQGDIYACLHGNNVSCRVACTTYGRVTCLTYQNTRACEQYIRERSTTSYLDTNSAGDSSLSTNSFDALRYSAFLAGGILLFVSLVSLLIYIIRKNPSQLLFFCTNKSLNAISTRKSTNRLTSQSSILQQHHQRPPSPSLNPPRPRYTPAPDLSDLPPSYYADRNQISTGDCYEPPPYPGPPLFSSVQRSDSIYYETIKTPSTSNSMSMLHPMPLPEPRAFSNSRTHRV